MATTKDKKNKKQAVAVSNNSENKWMKENNTNPSPVEDSRPTQIEDHHPILQDDEISPEKNDESVTDKSQKDDAPNVPTEATENPTWII